MGVSSLESVRAARAWAQAALACLALVAAPMATAQTAPPTARPATMTVPLNTPTPLNLAPFVSGTGLTGVAVRTAPSHGRVAENGLSVTYTPAPDFFGPDSFTYVVFGSGGAVSSPATVTVTVTGRPDASQDPVLAGLVDAQNRAARRFAFSSTDDIQRRMETLLRPEAVKGSEEDAATPTTTAQGPTRSFAPWVAGSTRFGNVEARAERGGGRFSNDSVTIGVDRRLGPALAAGVAVGFGRDEAEVSAGAARSTARGSSIAGYGSWQLGARAFLDMVLGYGWLELDSDRRVDALGQVAGAERKGRQLFGSVAGIYEWRRDNWRLAPYGRFDFLAAELDDATEGGVGRYALTYASQDLRAAQAALGARFESRHDMDSGTAIPRLRAEYRRDIGRSPNATVNYAEPGTGSAYAISPASTGRGALLLGGGLDLAFNGGLRLGVDYSALRAAGLSNTQAVRVMLSQDLDSFGAWNFEPALFRNSVSVDGGYAYEDNVSRSRDKPNRLWDHIFSASGTLTRTWVFGQNIRAQATGLLSGEKFDRWKGLGRVSPGVQAEFQYRASGTFDAPTYALVGRAFYDEFESSHRTGPRYFAGANVRRAVTDRIELFGEVGGNYRYGRSEVFRGHDFAVKVNADYALTRKSTLYLTGEFRQGDSVSSGPPSLAAGVAEVLVPDDAFESAGYIAYRVDTRTYLGTLGLNVPLGARDSIDLSWRRSEGRARRSLGFDGGMLRYVDNLYSLVYLIRF